MKKFLLILLVLIGLQTQAQQAAPYFCCDSITYWTDQGQGLFIGLDTSNIVHNPDSMQIYWGVCTNSMCYSGDGMSDYFPQITTADTIKVNYDVYIYENGSVEVCSIEDWLIFDGSNWVIYNMNTVGINELISNNINNNRMYDLLGREIKQVNIGQTYIKNNKKHIRIN